MNKPLRSSSTASIVVLASILAGCAAPQAESGAATSFGGKVGDIGLATRAAAALNANKVPEAIQLAEQAVAKAPTDAGFRALLGNAYFAGGRFRSRSKQHPSSRASSAPPAVSLPSTATSSSPTGKRSRPR